MKYRNGNSFGLRKAFPLLKMKIVERIDLLEHKNKKVAEQTRKNLIDAFLILYEKKRIEKITIKEITELAGYHRSNFYRYFDDVYDLLDKVKNELSDDLAEYCNEGMIGDMRIFTEAAFAHIYEEKNDWFTVLMKKDEESGFSLRIREKVGKVMEKYITFSDDPIVDRYVLEYRVAGSIATLALYYKQEKNIDVHKIINIMMELTLSGGWPMKKRE